MSKPELTFLRQCANQDTLTSEDRARVIEICDNTEKLIDEGRLIELLCKENHISEKIALAMSAGARAIEQNKRLNGKIYIYDVFSNNPKELSYREASEILREEAEQALINKELENPYKPNKRATFTSIDEFSEQALKEMEDNVSDKK